MDTRESNDPFDAVAARVAALREEAATNLRHAEQLRDSARDTTAEAVSGAGEVRVQADAGGRVSALSFGARAEQLPLAELAAVTLRTIGQAQQRAMQALANQSADLFGSDAEISTQISATADRWGEASGDGISYR
ncbi:hypothetical protein [Leucobacter japonicus]|uniref:hypothetical protein n=1 Tax=Leucobacter japonicus TaxID=1461259 RepID=UPI0006A78729|nr:hypothetical protein [Leucobacter japonicus]